MELQTANASCKRVSEIEIEQLAGTSLEAARYVSDLGLDVFKKALPSVSQGHEPPLRSCQVECLRACLDGAEIVEMACGTGKTRVMRELASQAQGRVLVLVPSRILLRQHSDYFPEYCRVDTTYNDDIDWNSRGFGYNY